MFCALAINAGVQQYSTQLVSSLWGVASSALPTLQAAYSSRFRDAVPIKQTVSPAGPLTCRPLCRLSRWGSLPRSKNSSDSNSNLLSRGDNSHLLGLNVRPYLGTAAAAAKDHGDDQVTDINNLQQPKEDSSNKELLTRKALLEYLRTSQLKRRQQVYGQQSRLSDDEEQKLSRFVYDLDDDQWKAAATAAPRVQVIAGPGAGKTRTLLARLLILLASGAQPEDIVVVAFTNSAAKELKERCSAMVGSKVADALNPCTIHELCRTLLRKDGDRLNLSVEFKNTRPTASKKERKQLILNILAERGLLCTTVDESRSSGKKGVQKKGMEESQSSFKEKAKAYFDAISQLKNFEEHIEGKSGEQLVKRHYVERKRSPSAQQLADVYDAYQRAMANKGQIDYDDELHHCLSLIKRHHDVLATVHKTWKYILVDETQDLNKCQHALFRAFTGPATSLFLVGDPYQNIYGFRGAAAADWQKTFEHVGGGQTVDLVNNYRSCPAIVDAAEVVRHISRDVCGGSELTKRRSTKQEAPASDPTKSGKLGDRVVLMECRTAEEEVDQIINQLFVWHRKGYKWQQMALLTHSVKPSVNSKIVDLQFCLRSNGIPVYKLESEDDKEEQRWLEEDHEEQQQEQLAMGKASTTVYQITASDDAVQLMTLHTAKGKEFPCVAVISANDLFYFTKDREKLEKTGTGEEESHQSRRIRNEIRQKYNLLYVGMSRARQNLYISSYKHAKHNNNGVSQQTQKKAKAGGRKSPHEWKIYPTKELARQLRQECDADKNSIEQASWVKVAKQRIQVYDLDD